eukprot:8302987-Pyramimonas_sp.AAC.1
MAETAICFSLAGDSKPLSMRYTASRSLLLCFPTWIAYGLQHPARAHSCRAPKTAVGNTMFLR